MLKGLEDIKIIILAADPECDPAFAPSDADAVKKVNANVQTAYVWVFLILLLSKSAHLSEKKRSKSWCASGVPRSCRAGCADRTDRS